MAQTRNSLPQGEATCRPCRAEMRPVKISGPRPQDRTHCPNGHEYTPTSTRRDKKGARRCTICEVQYQKRYFEAGRRPKVRSHRSWRVLRDQYRSECAATQEPCWICEQPIDYSLQWPHRMAFEADHIYGVKSYPELALDRSNLAPSHATCNKQRGATQAHAEASRREAFLLNQLELAQRELAQLRLSQAG